MHRQAPALWHGPSLRASCLTSCPLPAALPSVPLCAGPVPQELQGLSLFADGGDSFVMVDGISVPESFDLADNEFRWDCIVLPCTASPGGTAFLPPCTATATPVFSKVQL